MDLQLAGQTALVVGAARGIGRAVAQQFLAEGAHVVLWDSAPAVIEIAHELARESQDTDAEQASGRSRCIARQLDVTDAEAVDRAANELEQVHRAAVDHIVYAAGAGSGHYGCPFWRVPVDTWQGVWNVNLLGAVRVAHRFAPAMAERRGGTWLSIASVAGQIGSPTDPPYSAAKAALINFTQCMARDLAAYGVRANVISPGMIATTLNQSVWQAWLATVPVEQQLDYETWAAAKIQRVAPLGRWQTVEDVARLAVFLASPLADNITGQTMNVDGGQVMHS